MPEAAGVIHSLAAALIDALEARGSRETSELTEALKLVNEAVELKQRPRFLYTRARILRRMERYDEALDNLMEAIDGEDRQALDWRDRIAEYILLRAEIDMERAANRLIGSVELTLERRIEETVRRRVDGAELRLVQTIAFVAAAIGLVQASVATLGKRPVGQAMLIVFGLAIALFGAVGIGAVLIRRSLANSHESEKPTTDPQR